jgi:serine/threonine-protein kinase RsbW
MTYGSESSEARDGRIRCPLRRDKLVSQFCEVIPSTLDALNDIQDKVLAVVKRLPCAPEALEDLAIALREALVNAILHGNQNDPSKRVVVACFCECEENGGLLLVVRDEGQGFNPDEVPDPTGAEAIHSWDGRGIFLMRHFMDEVRYENGGSEVLLRKRKI